ncbi:hypothetical protein GCK32_006172 [Trichostrongylus colubriformis]|uniref:Uncharacterized protein n=1 Tax=Trichostrongylus colubriformis TaxID=6319 RepID=A0AAN8ILY5_TRICO
MESQLISKREAQDKDVLMENRKAVTAHLKSMLSDSNSAHYIERTCGEKFAAVGTDSAGNKLGKSVGGGDVWRRAVLSSSFHFYQFLHQLHDAEGEQMCELYSLAPWEGGSFSRLNEYVRSLRRVKLVTLFGNTIKVARNEMGDLVDRTRPDSVKGSALMTEGAIKVNGEKTIDNTTPSFSSG